MKMPIILIFVLFFGFTLFGISYGQGAPQEDPSLPEISLQLVLRNSEAQLEVYLEPTIMWLRNIWLIHEYLDTVDNKSIITIDGKNYEQIQFGRTETGFGGQISAYSLWYKGYPVLTFTHDGYMAQFSFLTRLTRPKVISKFSRLSWVNPEMLAITLNLPVF